MTVTTFEGEAGNVKLTRGDGSHAQKLSSWLP
jgi:hypothetical protein